jgi:hypothetical protein
MKKLILIITTFFFTIPNISLAQSSHEAFKALKKLETRCQVGISYSDYKRDLGDVVYEVSSYTDSLKAKRLSNLTDAMATAVAHYVFAGRVWELKMIGDKVIIKDDQAYREILKIYPKANKDISQGGALINFTGKTSIYIDALIPIIWSEASLAVREVERIMNR